MARKAKEPRWLTAARLRAADDKPDWLSRCLARAGLMPLAAAEAAIREGRVTMDGRPVHEPFSPLKPGARITVDGKVVDVEPTTRVLVFHKPRGLVVAGEDDEGTVFEALSKLLPAALVGYQWLAVGRLDRDTTGVLLFTNDERFVEHATSPTTHLEKRYLVTTGTVNEGQLERLRTGVEWDGERSRPAKAVLRAQGLVELTLTEGKHHQVKRMMNAVGLATLRLHREAVARYVLDVPEGTMRLLNDDEVDSLLGYRPRHRR